VLQKKNERLIQIKGNFQAIDADIKTAGDEGKYKRGNAVSFSNKEFALSKMMGIGNSGTERGHNCGNSIEIDAHNFTTYVLQEVRKWPLFSYRGGPSHDLSVAREGGEGQGGLEKEKRGKQDVYIYRELLEQAADVVCNIRFVTIH
jgi:hypothetical protein